MTNRRSRQQFDEQPRYREQRPTSWHLDKTFSIAMLGTLIVLSASGITAAVKLSDRVDDTVKDIASVQTEIKEEISARQAEIKETDKARTDMSAHFASIDVTLQDMKSMMFQSSQRAMQLVMPSTGSLGNSQQPIILQQAAPASIDGNKQGSQRE
jgi:hypothetical protein